jgi:hypothetical protein
VIFFVATTPHHAAVDLPHLLLAQELLIATPVAIQPVDAIEDHKGWPRPPNVMPPRDARGGVWSVARMPPALHQTAVV